MIKISRILAVIILTAFLLSTCAAGPDYNLYGTWRATQSGSLIEFRQDGTMRIPQSSGTAEVTYIFSGKGTILISPTPDTAADQMVKWTYTIDGDTLTLNPQAQGQAASQSGAQSVILKRVK